MCPEVEIGLGTPRDPIRLVIDHEHERLVQPSTGTDLTETMRLFSQEYLASLPAVDGFILKNRSPSCGVRDSKVYSLPDRGRVEGKGPGLFARAILERFPHAAIEDVGRLANTRIRDHFLTKLFVRAHYRSLCAVPNIQDLIRFQAQNKLLLMAYNQTRMHRMGRLIASYDGKNLSLLLHDYGEELSLAFARPPRFTSNINVLLHAFGYFSARLTRPEKVHFLDALERYRKGIISLRHIATILPPWIDRFDSRYLQAQTFFRPYPSELFELSKIAT